MNKKLKAIALQLLLASSTVLGAGKSLNYLNSPSGDTLLASRWLTTGMTDDEPRGVFFTGTAFWSRSNNKAELGRYFGATNKETVPVTRKTDATNILSGQDIEHIYDYTGSGDTNAPMSGVINLAPFREDIGVQLAGYISLEDNIEGLSVHASIPFLEARTNMGVTITSPQPSTATNPALQKGKETLKPLLNGLASKPTGKNHQEALKRAKVSPTALSSLGFGDLKLRVNYVLKEQVNYIICGALTADLPLGNKSEGIYMFEPIRGNGGSFGLGASLSGATHVWHDKAETTFLDASFILDYKYLFGSAQHRTLGVWDKSAAVGKLSPWKHLKLAVEKDAMGTFPAANVLTRLVNVTPGSQLEALAGLTVAKGNFAGSLGYSLFYRQAESGKLGRAWTNDIYGFAAHNYEADGAASNFSTHVTDGPIQGTVGSTTKLGVPVRYSASLAGCLNPSQTIHTFSGNMSYTLSYKDVAPVVLSVGGSYSAKSETAATGLSLWLNAGVIF